MTMNKPYSAEWFTDNELSQITPMPEEWDRTSATRHQQLQLAAVGLPGGVQVPRRAVGRQGIVLGLVAAVEHRGRPVEAAEREQRRVRQARAQPALLRPGRRAPHLDVHHRSRSRPSRPSSTCCRTRRAASGWTSGYLPTVDAPVPPPGAATGGNPATLRQLQADRAVPVGADLLPVQLHTTRRPGPIFKPAVLPAGVPVADRPGRRHRRAAARLRQADHRPGHVLPGHQLPGADGGPEG